mmetsp:Transcript_16855/g.40132  ORF Transcript_16855/g.40132 Transcript_16855/m.40132 type:complete len:83 (-) Transcript_16855:371-619(-)
MVSRAECMACSLLQRNLESKLFSDRAEQYLRYRSRQREGSEQRVGEDALQQQHISLHVPVRRKPSKQRLLGDEYARDCSLRR